MLRRSEHPRFSAAHGALRVNSDFPLKQIRCVALFPHPEPVPLLLSSGLGRYLRLHCDDGIEDSSIMFGFGDTVYGSTFRDVNFVPLQSATFCIQCELITTSSKSSCLACGSTALLSLS